MNQLPLGLVILGVVTGDAVAQSTATGPAPSPPATARPIIKPVLLELGVTAGNVARVYRMLVNLGDCADLLSDERDRNRNDEISVCAESSTTGILVRTKWNIRAGRTSYRTSWSSVVAAGGHVDLTSGNVRLSLAIK